MENGKHIVRKTDIQSTPEHKGLNINSELLHKELVPNLRLWDSELDRLKVGRLLWFVFGSAVRKSSLEEDTKESDQLLKQLLASFGIRESHNWGPESDIDIGLIVPDGHSDIEIFAYFPNSPFRTATVDGHHMELTRFELSWLNRRTTIENLRSGDHTLGTYGNVVVIDL